MKPYWYTQSQQNHQEHLARAQANDCLTSEAEIVNFLALAICGEAGELANVFKKKWRGDSIPLEAVQTELADIRIYLEHLATHLQIDLDAACADKVEEVTQRLRDEAV